MKDSYRELTDKLCQSDRVLVVALFWDTAQRIIVDNAPKGLNENQLKRYVYEKMYEENAPPELWT